MIDLKNTQGSVLIMALLIGSGMAVIGIEFALFVASSIQQSRNTDQAMVSLYAAESGLESALYQVRQEEISQLRTASDNLSNTAAWTLQPQGAEPRFRTEVPYLARPHLKESESLIFDIYTNNGAEAVAGLTQLDIEWKSKNGCSEQTSPRLSVSAIAWEQGSIEWTTDTHVVVQEYTATGAKVSADFSKAPFQDPPQSKVLGKPLVLQVRMLACNLENVTFTLRNAAGNRLMIPNYFFIKPTGVYGSRKEDILAIVPKRTTHSGLFDFVLFSEQEICKADPLTGECPTD
jgi:hypothetical protein